MSLFLYDTCLPSAKLTPFELRYAIGFVHITLTATESTCRK